MESCALSRLTGRSRQGNCTCWLAHQGCQSSGRRAKGQLLRANGAPANIDNALFNYNRSNRYVRAVKAYADQMKADERAYLGYYHWQVYYFDTWLPEGWTK